MEQFLDEPGSPVETPRAPLHLYNEEFFRTKNYAGNPFRRFSTYWFSRRYYAALLRRYAPPGADRSLLDAGCGMGHLLELLQDDFRCTGYDVMDYAVEQSRLIAPRADVFVASGDEQGRFADDEFSAVVGLGLVEHLERPADFIRDTYRILRPGGIFFFLTPNPEYGLRRRKDPTRDVIGEDPTHINLKPPREWLSLCRENGFVIERQFADGWWDVPYVPLLPKSLQLAIFGLPAALQVLTRSSFLPVGWGVCLLVMARKPAR